MHIYIDNGTSSMPELDLPFDFWPELSRTNPFLTEEGSQSIPLTLPASEHNMKTLGWQHRINHSKRPPKSTKAIFSDNAVWMNGTLNISEVNKKEGITSSFYTNEGRIYEKIKGYLLKDLEWPKYTGTGADTNTKVKYWLDKFLQIMSSPENQLPDYYIFSVITDYTFVTIVDKEFDEKLILNQFENPSSHTPNFIAEKERKYKDGYGDNANEYTVPRGYGVTPFLRIGFILEHIFHFFGYSLITNIFDTDPSLKRLCILNNTADSIVSGVLDYTQLMPDDLSVEDFINIIRKKFAVEFIENNGYVTIQTWNQVLSSSPDIDLSKYIREDITWIHQESKSIVIEITGTKNEHNTTYTTEVLKHESLAGAEEENVSTDDKTPFNEINVLYYYKHLDNVIYLSAPFIGGITHKNSELILSGESQENEKENRSMDIMFCFSIPHIQKVVGDPVYYYAGTIWSYDNNDETWGTVSLVVNEIKQDVNPATKGIDNLYNRYYQKRDNMLQLANQQIVTMGNIPSHLISTMDISTPKIIQGMKVLIERIDYVLGHPDLCQITARTLHQYPE